MAETGIFGDALLFSLGLAGSAYAGGKLGAFLRMGTASFEQSDIVQETQNTQEMQEEDWSGEIFGVEVRVQDGRIVFFQERKGRVLEGE